MSNPPRIECERLGCLQAAEWAGHFQCYPQGMPIERRTPDIAMTSSAVMKLCSAHKKEAEDAHAIEQTALANKADILQAYARAGSVLPDLDNVTPIWVLLHKPKVLRIK